MNIKIKEGNVEVDIIEATDVNVDKIKRIIKNLKEAQKKEVKEAF